jgi:GH35 family endo-1,4-beta-xylanase
MNRVKCTETQWRHRLGRAVVEVTGPEGPLKDAPVTVAQVRHAFRFGATGFEAVPGYQANDWRADRREEVWDQAAQAQWLDLFNFATLPFYWGRYEPEAGVTIAAQVRAAAEWFTAHGVALKGHPLTWHTLAPRWLAERPLDQVEATLRGRVRREVGGFAGLIDTWDSVNESVIAPLFTKEANAITRLTRDRGRLHVLRLTFEEALAANPQAKLLLNDFDLSAAYECLIEAVLEAGLPVTALGLQTHMHQGFRGEDALNDLMERFARYGLPLHFTETTLVSGHLMPPEIVDLNDYQVADWPTTEEGEARQADELVRHYRTLLAHPAVEASTYWDVFDANAWLGAPSGLVRRDGTPKPAYLALRALVKGAWWIEPVEVTTDQEGRFEVEGFLGGYSVTAGGKTAAFDLARGESAIRAELE